MLSVIAAPTSSEALRLATLSLLDCAGALGAQIAAAVQTSASLPI